MRAVNSRISFTVVDRVGEPASRGGIQFPRRRYLSGIVGGLYHQHRGLNLMRKNMFLLLQCFIIKHSFKMHELPGDCSATNVQRF